MTATHGEGAYGNAAGVTTPTAHKLAQVTEFVKTTTANVIRPGVLYNGNASLVSGKANMSYDVAPFSIVTQRSATAGVLKWANDATYNVPTTAAPGSNSRYDVVYAWHREFALDGTDSNPVIGAVQGTAAASPTVPSLAAYPGAIELARILVPAGVTATNSGTTITQTAPFTSVDGGKVPFRTTTEMNVWTTALTDQQALDLSSGITYRWSGAAWKAWESDWISYTPTLTSVALGTGSSYDCRYKLESGVVRVVYQFVLGSSGFSVSGIPVMTLPPFASATPRHAYALMSADASFLDVAPLTAYPSEIAADNLSTTQVRIYAHPYPLGPSSTVPFTWAAGDTMQGEFTYRQA